MSSRSPPRARPLPLRDAAGRVVDSTRAAAAANAGSESTKGGGGRRGSTSVMASSVGGAGSGVGAVGRSSLDLLRASSSSPSSPLSLLVRRLLSTPLAPCLAYGAISICITLFNKAVFSVYRFQFPAFVTALQVRREGKRPSCAPSNRALSERGAKKQTRRVPSRCENDHRSSGALDASVPEKDKS